MKWRFFLLFLIPLLLTRSVAPDLKTQQFLEGGKNIKEVPEGTYILSDYQSRRTKEEYVEFVKGDQSFWGKVPKRIDIPKGSIELTVLKNGRFVEVVSATSLEFEEKTFRLINSQKGQILLLVEGQIKPVEKRPQCIKGTVLISEGKVKEVRC